MAKSKVLGFLLLLFFCVVLLSVFIIQGCSADRAMLRHSILAQREQLSQLSSSSPQQIIPMLSVEIESTDTILPQGKFKGEDRNSRRLMIGSTMPTCTYNECRGCRFRCRAEQVPVEGNDPVHSAYRYRCVCHHR